MITGIIVALPEELSTLTKKKIPYGKCEFLAENILVTHSGTGPDNALNAALRLLEKGCSKLISWGCAAGLAEGLSAGDLCLPKQLITENQQHISVHTEWRQQTVCLLDGLQPIHSGPLSTSSSIISSSRKKKVIHQSTGAIALDMESTAIARIAEQEQIPCLVIRVIADTVDMNLPTAITKSMDGKGEINNNKLALNIITNPLQIPDLIKLGLHFQNAQKKLNSVAKKIWEIADFPITHTA